jgi:hypothetical protein
MNFELPEVVTSDFFDEVLNHCMSVLFDDRVCHFVRWDIAINFRGTFFNGAKAWNPHKERKTAIQAIKGDNLACKSENSSKCYQLKTHCIEHITERGVHEGKACRPKMFSTQGALGILLSQLIEKSKLIRVQLQYILPLLVQFVAPKVMSDSRSLYRQPWDN